MTGIEKLREWANELREAARAYRDGEIGYVPIDIEACQRKNAARLDAIADQIEREIKESLTDWADDGDDAVVDMSGARAGIEMLRSYVHHARVHVRNLYINNVADINAVPLYEKLRECLRQLDEIADRIERETLPRPRFEDGEPVNVGDAFVGADGTTDVVTGIFAYVKGDETAIFAGNSRIKRPIPEPPDTWERLAADIEDCDGSACEYFGRIKEEGMSPCCECNAYNDDTDCTVQVMCDIVRRAKKLAGVE